MPNNKKISPTASVLSARSSCWTRPREHCKSSKLSATTKRLLPSASKEH